MCCKQNILVLGQTYCKLVWCCPPSSWSAMATSTKTIIRKRVVFSLGSDCIGRFSIISTSFFKSCIGSESCSTYCKRRFPSSSHPETAERAWRDSHQSNRKCHHKSIFYSFSSYHVQFSNILVVFADHLQLVVETVAHDHVAGIVHHQRVGVTECQILPVFLSKKACGVLINDIDTVQTPIWGVSCMWEANFMNQCRYKPTT